MIDRFLEPAPFSKFYLQLDNESPGKVGRWIGWQIVRYYHKNNPEISLKKLIKTSSQELLIYQNINQENNVSTQKTNISIDVNLDENNIPLDEMECSRRRSIRDGY